MKTKKTQNNRKKNTIYEGAQLFNHLPNAIANFI